VSQKKPTLGRGLADLLGQARLTQTTRRLLDEFLQPKWFRTPAVIGHAKLFFDDFRPTARISAASTEADALSESLVLNLKDPKLREYVCYVLLDFVTADPELDEVPLAAALEFSRRLDIEAPFEKLAARELKMKARDVRRVKDQAAELLAKAEATGE
jgi:hypothetical protein